MKKFQAYTVSRDGVVVYVGVTVRTIAVRWQQHQKSSGCRALSAAIRKYGADTFVIAPVASARNVSDLGLLERQLIGQYGTLSPNGYNLKTDNMLNCIVSEETRDRQRASQTGKVRSAAAIEKHRIAMTGKKLSPEHCIKIGNMRRGRIHSATARAKMSMALAGKLRGPLSQEHRSKLAAAKFGRPGTPFTEAAKAKQRARFAGKKRPPRSPEWCERIRTSKTGIIATPDTRAKMALAQQARREREKLTNEGQST